MILVHTVIADLRWKQNINVGSKNSTEVINYCNYELLGRLFSALARNILSVGDTNSNDLFLGIIEKLKIRSRKIQPIHFRFFIFQLF